MSDDSSSDRDDEATGDNGGATEAGDRDPFDSFEEHRDRKGDPFDSLDEDSPQDSSGEGADPDPFEYGESGGSPSRRDEDGERGSRGGDGTGDPSRDDVDDLLADADDPLADVEVSDGDPFEAKASAFERSDVEGIDPDEVWARLTAEPDDSDPGTNSESGAGAGADEGPSSGEDDVAEVSKHAYCEECEHFSPPPDVTCTNEGTEILEFVAVDTVRVADCPVVAERRELEDDP
ncbi:hypothetical protein [Halosimplex sp. TS25]|uniref:hypothetical protein n=1 Tax=Halosimplex rarum TaxID=3396619 RepID=UPI0039ECAFEA